MTVASSEYSPPVGSYLPPPSTEAPETQLGDTTTAPDYDLFENSLAVVPCQVVNTTQCSQQVTDICTTEETQVCVIVLKTVATASLLCRCVWMWTV